MEGRILDKIAKPFNIELPEKAGIEPLLDEVLPIIRTSSDGLDSLEQLHNKSMLEVTDSMVDNRRKLWILKPSGSILRTLDEKVDGGSYDVVGGGKIMISSGFGQTMYTLAFMDSDHLILRLYGNNRNPDGARYLLLVSEPIAAKLEWNDIIERLLAKYKNSNTSFLVVTLAIVLVALLFVVLSGKGG